MSLILAIETSTDLCSVALQKDHQLIAHRSEEGMNHSSLLTILIQDILKQGKINKKDLSAIAVSKGPGSYTGLRVGVSVAKGLCYALDIPLIGINTLKAMTSAAIAKIESSKIDVFGNDLVSKFCPMIDARRMEVFTSVFDQDFRELVPVQAKIIDENSFTEINSNTYFFGNGAAKCIDILKAKSNFIYLENIFPDARYIAELAEEPFLKNHFEDLAYFEPEYGKEFYNTNK